MRLARIALVVPFLAAAASVCTPALQAQTVALPRSTSFAECSDDEMRDLMRDIVNRLYTFHLCADDPKLQAEMEKWMAVAGKWDDPEIDPRMIGGAGSWPTT